MSRMPKNTGNEQKSVKPKVRAILDRWGWFWWANPGSPFGKSGISDTCAIKAGVMLCVESKFGSNKATALQIGFLNSINMENGFGLVVNEKTLVDLDIFLGMFDAATKLAGDGKVAPADIGGPMLDALKRLQDYPRDLDEFARTQRAKSETLATKHAYPVDTHRG